MPDEFDKVLAEAGARAMIVAECERQTQDQVRAFAVRVNAILRKSRASFLRAHDTMIEIEYRESRRRTDDDRPILRVVDVVNPKKPDEKSNGGSALVFRFRPELIFTLKTDEQIRSVMAEAVLPHLPKTPAAAPKEEESGLFWFGILIVAVAAGIIAFHIFS